MKATRESGENYGMVPYMWEGGGPVTALVSQMCWLRSGEWRIIHDNVNLIQHRLNTLRRQPVKVLSQSPTTSHLLNF